MPKKEDTPEGVSVHTGFPNPAADNRLTGLDLNQLLIKHATGTYMFRVRGNEWEGAGVFDGDIALIDRHLDRLPCADITAAKWVPHDYRRAD